MSILLICLIQKALQVLRHAKNQVTKEKFDRWH